MSHAGGTTVRPGSPSGETDVALRVKGLSKRYGAVPVLDDVSFEIPAGGSVAVLGPSGSGKSTLLRIVAGLVDADDGRIEISGETTDDPRRRVPPERRRVAFLFQDLALWPHMTVRGNLDFVLDARGVPRDVRGRAAAESARVAGFPEALLDRRPAEISGGERQRAALARVLAQEPRLLLLDEPLSHLDPSLRASLLVELKRLLEARGLASLLVTHDTGEAFALAATVVVLRRGRIEQSGPPAEVYDRPRSRHVAEIVGRATFIPAERRGGVLVTALGEFAATGAPEGPVLAVVRPERVRAASGGPIEAVVVDALCQGDHWVWIAEIGGVRFAVRADRPAARGAAVRLAADPPAFVPAEEGDR